MSSLLFTATRRWPTQAPSRSGRNLPYRLPDKAQYPGSVRTAMLGSGRIYPPLMCIAVVWIGREPHRISQLESRTLLAGPPTRGSAIGTASESCIPGSGFAKPPGPGSQPTLARSAPDHRRASANVASKPGFRRASPGSPPSEEGAIRNGFAEQRSYRPRNQEIKRCLALLRPRLCYGPARK
jgi:hypothetical protein